MPRRRKRFEFLEKALKAAGGTPTQGVLLNYAQFKAGINKANAGTIPPSARKSVGYCVLPFGNDFPASVSSASYYRVKISVFSNDWRKTAGLGNAELGYDTINYSGATISSGYYPATAKIFIGSGAGVQTISGITKVGYKKRTGKNYSVPFGIHVTQAMQNSEFEQQAAMIEIIGNIPIPAGASKSISFLPEQIVKTRAEPSAGQ